ncbi:putative target of rapamycin (TOR) kinase 1 [Trypanosoma cruzi Dm28c]|uniref:Putative target of rapamycin (TOR) kinase 1 n=1 Tax=Trypanosoma cruzi Dm28c TaxID=1416333 RepID=V5B3Q4_TRYCR|nr:putative target of rapamycin (TOR) kinase 1 [Trypanosoma cruzi Dm28c]
MQVWTRRAVPFPSALLRQGARKLTEDSSRRRAIAEGSGNNRGRFFCKNRRIDNTLLVVEEKTTGLRRRWIAWPRDRNRDDAYEANFSFLHVSHCLPPVMAEAASCLDLKASFFKSLYRGRLGISFDAAWRKARWWS